MNQIEIPIGEKSYRYRYVVGNHTIGIIPPSRNKHTVTIEKVHGSWLPTGLPPNGTHDNRVTVGEIVKYILANRIV